MLINKVSHIEASSADKLSQQGVCRHIFASNSHKIVKKFQQPFGFEIFFGIPVNSKEQRLHILFENSQFVQKRRIEHHIRLFLKRKDVLLLPPSH